MPASDVPLLGEVIAWNATGVRVSYTQLRAALTATGLDAAMARELAPRHAWARACHHLEEGRIIRRLATEGDDDTTIRFQFNKQQEVSGQYEYPLETVCTLDTATGKVDCSEPGLTERAQQLLDEAVATRTAQDVTRLVQRLFERKADLFPIRDQGGCYFVPACYGTFVDTIEKFVASLGGTMRRFPVPKGVERGSTAVRDSVTEGLGHVISEHLKAVDSFDAETRQGTIDRAVKRINVTRVKLEAYAEYLGDQQTQLLTKLAEAKLILLAKVDALGLKGD